jgi:DNA-binding XRE family transcriptional regulator
MGYRRQPVNDLMIEQRWNSRTLANEIGVERVHLQNVMKGMVHPNAIVREKLPKILKAPLEDLFDEDLLAREYNAILAERRKNRETR